MTTETQTAETAQAPSLQLADLILVLKLIQVTAQRGAIRAEEMAEVGALHDKLFAFLKQTGALTQAPAPGEQPAQPATEGDSE